MTSRGFGVPVAFPGGPELVASLEHKKQLATDLCEALLTYLTHDLDLMIEQVSRKRPRPPRPTIEDLNRPQEQLDLAQNALTAIDNMCEDMPEKLGEMMRLTQSPQVQRWIQEAQGHVSFIQQAMEEPEDQSADPWAGISLVAMCVKCAAVSPSDIGATHPKELNALLMAAGWKRDEDGDLICPKCASAASTEPPSPPAAPATAESRRQQR